MSAEVIAESRRPSRRRVVLALVGTAVVTIGAAWYLWPSVSGADGDVAVVTDSAFDDIVPHLREELRVRGRELASADVAGDWCELAERVAARPPDSGLFVIAIEARGSCQGDPVEQVVAALAVAGVDPVLVVPPGSAAPKVEVRVVPVEQLVGAPGTLSLPCEWWDDCSFGYVRVRLASGAFTDAAADRIARMVAATIG